MILRRVATHVRAQDWFSVAIDFLIVVVGVFIGLQVQEWSKHREERQREMQIVADLLADLDIDRSQYANGLAIDAHRVSAANASLKGAALAPLEFNWEKSVIDVVDYSFDTSLVSQYPASRLDRLWTDVVLGFHPTPSTATFDAMVGAGDIKVLRDRQIVRELQTYHNLTESVLAQNEKLLAIRGDVLNIGASSGLAPYARMPAADYFKLVAATPQLAAAIRIMATFAIYHHGELQSADARAAKLQVWLTDYLATMR